MPPKKTGIKPVPRGQKQHGVTQTADENTNER